MHAQLRSSSYALLASFLIRNVGASCYYPDGNFPSDYAYVPCTGDQFSSCCIQTEGDQCLSNGLCFYPFGNYAFRGACTDKTWNSPNCFQHCKGTGPKAAWDKILVCGGNRYCCSSDGSSCCNDDTKAFTLGAASVNNNLGNTISYTLPFPAFSNVASATPFSSATGKATPIPTNANPIGTSPAAPGEATNTAPAAAPAPSTERKKSKTPVIAVIVAVIVVVVAAILFVWILVRRRYRKKLAAVTNAQPMPTSNDGSQRYRDKSPRPIDIPAPARSPAPPYQSPSFQSPPPLNNAVEMASQYNAVEMENQHNAPRTNQWGHPVYEAPVHRD